MSASSYAPFSRYRRLLGKPREGLHKWRVPIVDLAAFDLAATAVGAYLLSPRKTYTLVTINFLLLWSAGVILHKMFAIHEPEPEDTREFIRRFKERVATLDAQANSAPQPSWKEAAAAFGIQKLFG